MSEHGVNMHDKEMKKGVILSYTLVILNVVSGLVFTPYLIKSLGNSQYGLYEIIVSLASNMTILNFGMSDCVVKFVSTYRTNDDKRKQGEVVGAVFKILSIGAFVAAVLCVIVYAKFDVIYIKSLTDSERVIGKQLLILSSINLCMSIPGGIFSCVLTAYEKFSVVRGMNIVRIFLRIILVIVFIHFSPSAMSVLVVDMSLNILLIIFSWVLMHKWLSVPIIFKSDNKELYKKIFSFSGYTMFFLVVKEVQWQTDKTIIGMRLNTEMVTIYAAGSKISAMFNQLGYTLSGMFLPRAVRLSEEGTTEEGYRKYMLSMGRLILPLIFGVLIAYVFMGKAFIFLWLGENFELAFYSSLIMMGAVFIPILQDTGVAILKARDKQKGIATAWLCSSFANIVLTWIVVSPYGIVAASIMTFITSYVGNVIVLNVLLKKEFDFKITLFFKELFKGTGGPIILSIVYFVFLGLLDIGINNWCSFIIVGTIFVILYVILLYFFYLSKEQRKTLKSKIMKH